MQTRGWIEIGLLLVERETDSIISCRKVKGQRHKSRQKFWIGATELSAARRGAARRVVDKCTQWNSEMTAARRDCGYRSYTAEWRKIARHSGKCPFVNRPFWTYDTTTSLPLLNHTFAFFASVVTGTLRCSCTGYDFKKKQIVIDHHKMESRVSWQSSPPQIFLYAVTAVTSHVVVGRNSAIRRTVSGVQSTLCHGYNAISIRRPFDFLSKSSRSRWRNLLAKVTLTHLFI